MSRRFAAQPCRCGCPRCATAEPRTLPSARCRAAPSRLHPRGSAQRGFALLEVLVAAAIAAVVLGVLFHAGLDGLRAAQAASHYEQAVARARSHLTLAVHASPLAGGDWRGDDGGGFAWHLHVAPLANISVRPPAAFAMPGNAGFPLTLYAVSVAVAWRDGTTSREVRLETQQIGDGTQ